MQPARIVAAIGLIGALALLVLWRFGGQAPEPSAGADVAPAVERAVAQAPAPGEAELPAAGETGVFAIDAAQSEVYWRIYRAGAAAALGHNHVISVGELAGSITLGSDLAAAQWNLRIPVQSLIVDDPAIRARYGEEFESVPSEEDTAGTKRNMLTDRVLNGEVYSEIRLSGVGVQGTLDAARLPVSIEILGRTIEQSFPARIAIGADSVTVTGEHRLTHEDLGMEPFTAFGGLMAVGDDIDLTYRLHAVAGD